MSQHDMNVANQSGAGFRSDMNNAIAALASLSSGSIDPATAAPAGVGVTFAFQLWVDTSGANPILKIRNAANTGWVVLGRVDLASFGTLILAATAYQTMAGPLVMSSTDYLKLPVGTTAQRPDGTGGTLAPTDGMIRYNSSLTSFEGYRSGAWAPIGGGGFTVQAAVALTGGQSLTASTTDARQLIPVAGTGGSTALSTTPFGVGGGWKDGTEVMVLGTSNANPIVLTNNDSAKGLVGNFDTLELGLYATASMFYNAALDRWILTNR